MSRMLLIAILSSLLLGCGCGAEFGLLVERRGLYYFDDLPYGFRPNNGYWHRNYCWYDGYWYHEGRSTPYGWDFEYGDPYFW